MKTALLVDFGSTYTKVVAVNLETKAILGTSKSFTTITSDITLGLNSAIKELEELTGIKHWNHRLGCSSAGGGLKMVAVGLVPELTSKAAKMAALSAGAKVLKTYSYKINEDESEEIATLMPDILLLSGGTDGGNEDVVLHNARSIVASKGSYPVIYAGNKSVITEIKKIFGKSSKDLIICPNVMPKIDVLDTKEVKKTIASLFLSRIIEAKGLKKAESMLDNILMPTPSAVLKAAELLSLGHKNEKGMGDLLVVDMGGATTDIHSACEGFPRTSNVVLKGLKEPYIKRSVEGDLGARYSLMALLEVWGMEEIIDELGFTKATMDELLLEIKKNPGTIAKEGSLLEALDLLSAKIGVSESVKRHAGTIERHYTPFGEMFEQVGKDLSHIKTIIGTGGPIIHHKSPEVLLANACFDPKTPMSLRPTAPSYYLDKSYIMASMGLLSEVYPEIALHILKNEINYLGGTYGTQESKAIG